MSQTLHSFPKNASEEVRAYLMGEEEITGIVCRKWRAGAIHAVVVAHALGHGAVWLSCTEKTAKNFQQKYGLPEYIKPALHFAIGWAAIGSIKSLRMPLSDMMITRK
jgi:hypothetical protein